jgi:cobalt-zinc-cadmium efflux system outer membrane protein
VRAVVGHVRKENNRVSKIPVRAAAIAASVVFLVSGLGDGASAQAVDSTAFHPDSTVTLADARALTVQRHPALASARALVEAARKRRTDAGRRPNPVLSGEVENFGNSSEENRLETTVQLGQTLELGGDRKARSLVAEASLQLAEADLSTEERTVLATTAERFLDAWGLQERLGALRAAEQLSAEAIQAAQERHRAGAAPVTERVRAEAQFAVRRVEREKAENELVLARHLLAAQWGDPVPSFTKLSPGERPVGTTAEAEWVAVVDSHPQRLRAAAEVILQEARVREARASRVPDLDVQFGVRHLAETGSSGFVAGVAFPLPLWNGQRGGVAAAEAEASAARLREQGTRIVLRSELEAAVSRVAIASSAEEAYRTRIRPSAEEALRQVRSAYRAGRLTYTDFIEAQRVVREAELALIDANVDLWRARVALDRLVGTSVPGSPREESR